uniref:Actin-binding protein f n=1 Tax=Tetraselmis sp. GSL018 TaxID=582737 RepID=A0A061RNP8_9CHLO
MLLSGCEDERRWEEALEAAGRDPEQLRSRSELRFAPESKREFLPGGEVVLRALVKNCGSSVTAKVYELNAWNHCRGLGREPDAEVALDGLCATHELTVPLREASPYVLQRVDVAIPQISGRRGVFVVELIEAGLACRALVRVGYISAVQEATPAGHALLLFWEDGSVVQGGKVWLNHEVHEEGERAGVVLVPFAESPAPGQQAVLGCRGSSFAGMFTFDQREERYELTPGMFYELTAGMFMEGESLVSKAEAPLIVRAQLHIHGTLVPVSLLSEVTLSVTTKDAEGTERVHKREVGKAELERSPELFLSEGVSLPERPMQVRAVLRGRVRLASRRDPQTGEPEVCDLAAEESWTAPGASEKMVGVYFSRVPDGFCLLVKGRAGEAVAGAVAAVTLQPHAFDLDPSARRHGGDVLTRRMQTDDEGCIRLGQLIGFKRVCVRLMGTPNSPGIELRQNFEIPQLPSTRHDDGGAPVVVPVLRNSGVMVPAAPAPETPALSFGGHRIPCEWAPRLVSLSLLRGDERAVEDLSARCLLEGGFAVLRNLPPGEYRLWAEPGRSVRVTAMADSSDGRLRLPNGARWLSDGGSVSRAVGEEDPLRICSFAADSEQGVSLSLGGSDSALAGARVCLALTTFTPDLGAAPVAAALRPPGGSPRSLARTKLPLRSCRRPARSSWPRSTACRRRCATSTSAARPWQRAAPRRAPSSSPRACSCGPLRPAPVSTGTSTAWPLCLNRRDVCAPAMQVAGKGCQGSGE